MGYAYEQMLVRSVEEATARAEAAEARNKVLEEALRYMANTSLIDDDYQAIAREALGGEHGR